MSMQENNPGPSTGFFHQAQNTNASGSIFVDVNHLSGTMNAITNINVNNPIGALLKDPASMTRFTNVPVDLLSPHFTGRNKELEQLGKIFDGSEPKGDLPIRCAIHGMPGLGKTQLALQYCNSEYVKKRFSHVFWMSSTTTDELRGGFEKVFGVVRHPSVGDIQPDEKFVAVRRWLEESGDILWLMVFDNVAKETLDFLREYIPRTNAQGRILYTTRTRDVAKLVINAAGHLHHSIALDVLDVQDAAKLFLADADMDTADTSVAVIETARQLASNLGRLPLAIVQAASFKRNSPQSIEQILLLCQDASSKSAVIEWENDLGVYEQKSVSAVFSSLLNRLNHSDPITKVAGSRHCPTGVVATGSTWQINIASYL